MIGAFAKVSSIATWKWTNNPHKPTLDRFPMTLPMTQTPDICVFFHIRNHQKGDTKKFWMEEKCLLQPTIVISNRSTTATTMDLEIKNLIPWQLAYLSDEVHFTREKKAGQDDFMWDHDEESTKLSVKAEMKNVNSDKDVVRIVYGYIQGQFRHGIYETVIPLI